MTGAITPSGRRDVLVGIEWLEAEYEAQGVADGNDLHIDEDQYAHVIQPMIAEIRASLSAPEMGGVERCPECGCREQARVQERKPDGKFGDGPLVRCVNCKRTWPSPSPAVAEVVAVLESIQMLKRSIMIDVGSCHSMRGPGASSEMREDDRELRRDIEAAFAKIDTLLATLRGRGL